MRLTGFQVKNFKSILDSREIKIDPNVTCLMGMNESGKSSVMQALWKFKNVSKTKFDPLYDLPAQDFTNLRDIVGHGGDSLVGEFHAGEHVDCALTLCYRGSEGHADGARHFFDEVHAEVHFEPGETLLFPLLETLTVDLRIV